MIVMHERKTWSPVNRRNQPKQNITEVEMISMDILDIHLSAVVFEVNLVGSNLKEWWVDTGSTHHICIKKLMFSSYQPVEGENYSCII